jgi:hypothetical protein
MRLPRIGSVHVGDPALGKKMPGIDAFFKGAWPGLFRVLQRLVSGVVNDIPPTIVMVGQNNSPSGHCDVLTRSDMAEKYMSFPWFAAMRQTGVNWLLLSLNCARWACFAVFAVPQGCRKRRWFKNENDNLAVPMQPSRLSTLMLFDLGSSGLRPADTNGIEQQPT